MTDSHLNGSSQSEASQHRTQKRVAIVQSNYIPWKGYFDMIASVDHFLFLDEVQYTRRDWRNRNQIKTHKGLHWLTIPVQVKGNFYIPINEVKVADPEWAKMHWETLRHAYRTARCFDSEARDVAEWYREAGELTYLSEINELFIRGICDKLGIRTKLSRSTDHKQTEDLEPVPAIDRAQSPTVLPDDALRAKNDRILNLCRAVGSTVYLSGPAAKSYINEQYFSRFAIEVEWMSYEPYPVYPQLHGEFLHGVSILDLLFSMGAESKDYFRKISTDAGSKTLAQEPAAAVENQEANNPSAW